jgi:DNA modification methylase
MELKIKEEFKKLIPPLTPDEYKQLETNCIEEGIRDAIITWNGYIIDGHNRYKIAQDWQLGYNTIEKDFESEEYVKEWMIINQFGRRNLSNYDRAKLGLELKEILEYKAKLKESLRKSIQQTKAIDLENIKPEQKAIVEILSGYKKRAYATPDKIYFIQNEDKVKIGVSNDVESRLKDIKKHIPDCHLIGYCAGGIDLEKQIHNSLNECKLHNEWFKLNDLSITLIKSFVENCDFSDLRKVNSYKEASEKFKIGIDTIAKVKKIEQKAAPEIKEKLSTGELSINQAYQDIKKEEKKIILEHKKEENAKILSNEVKENKPIIYISDCRNYLKGLDDNSFDLLITDPPYSTDVDNIEKFAESWVNLALSKVKKTGRAFICIGAYPKEINAYLNILLKQDKFIVDNPIIWSYKNTLGITPKMKYNLNYQMILHLYSDKSPELDISITNEMFNVMEINAPDGRLGNRYHTWQKPDELGMRLIKHSTKENDKVLDCFACTGTFLLMAAKMNRQSLGCEINIDNSKIAKERGCTILGM